MTKEKKTTEERIRDKYILLHNRKPFPLEKIQQRILILSTPRSGSKMFCDVLQKTGKMGMPREWLNIRYITAYANIYETPNVDMQAYLKHIMERSTSENGVFSLNMHIDQYLFLKERFGFDTRQLIFDKTYYLYRQDKARQAYSYALASATDQWTAQTKAKTVKPVQINQDDLARIYKNMLFWEEVYQSDWSEKADNTYAYEDFKNIENTKAYNEVLNDSGTNTDCISFKTEYRPQSDSGEEPEALRKLRLYIARTSS